MQTAFFILVKKEAMYIHFKIALFVIIIIGIYSCESKPTTYSMSSDTSALRENNVGSLPVDQTKEKDFQKASSKIDSEVDKIYEDSKIKIISSTPMMDKDFKRFYSIKIHNGSNKEIIGVIVHFNFNKITGDSIQGYKIDDNKNCAFSRNIKVSITRKTNHTYKISLPNETIDCDSYPQINIMTAVFSDGTFNEIIDRVGVNGVLDELDEKEKIRKSLVEKKR